MTCLICRRGNKRVKLAKRTIGNHVVDLCDECSKSLFVVDHVERRIAEQVADAEKKS